MDDVTLGAWLALREAADHAARAASVCDPVLAALPRARPLRVVDLATGAGSNLRYLMPRLSGPQRWIAVDRSPLLLEHLETRTAAWAAARGLTAAVADGRLVVTGDGVDCTVEPRIRDLDRLDDDELFEGVALVTASALLDLVSETWLHSLAAQCRRAGAAALFTITYDGRFACDPRDPDDEWVRDLFNRHQLRDKGLGGPAAGPGAVDAAALAFRDAGFTVHLAPSDWALPPDAREFQRMLVEGWAGAATEVAPERATAIAAWRDRRLAHVDAGRSRLRVGHQDLAATGSE